jgi:hypothetical protein
MDLTSVLTTYETSRPQPRHYSITESADLSTLQACQMYTIVRGYRRALYTLCNHELTSGRAFPTSSMKFFPLARMYYHTDGVRERGIAVCQLSKLKKHKDLVERFITSWNMGLDKTWSALHSNAHFRELKSHVDHIYYLPRYAEPSFQITCHAPREQTRILLPA